jgi:hypothetical protein
VTLIELPDLIQGTDEWLDQRRGMVTASVVGQLVTASTLKVAKNDYSRALTAQLVAERITGWTDPQYVSDDMLRGHEDEPRARDLYSEHFAPVVESGFMVRTEDNWKLGYSPDGLVGDDGLIEVKSRRPKKHLTTILSGEVPPRTWPSFRPGCSSPAANGSTTSPTAAGCRCGSSACCPTSAGSTPSPTPSSRSRRERRRDGHGLRDGHRRNAHDRARRRTGNGDLSRLTWT